MSPSIEEIRQLVSASMSRRGVGHAGVFGLVARGVATLDSDVDFLVEFEKGRTLPDLSGLSLFCTLLFCLAVGFPLSAASQAHRIPGPPRISTLPAAVSTSPSLSLDDVTPTLRVRRASNWKGAVTLGVITGAIFGLVVSQQDDEGGGDRPTGDKFKSGLLAGAMIAVPVTVIVAMLTAED